MRPHRSALVVVAIFALVAAGCGVSVGGAATPSSPGVSLTGEQLLAQRCTVCHDTNRITNAHHTREEWVATVTSMTKRGAKLNADETQVLIDYLAATYAK